MAKQIICTQDNTGISINNTFLNSDKTKKDITGYTCTVDIVYPDNTKENLPVEVVTAADGLVLFVLGAEQTAQTGLYKLYFNLLDVNSLVTAQDMITYYVIEKTGGV
jgi:5-hydroxyisourate hydrolase-like protein (transthyretin family)